jgi:hypothetical protein
LSRDPIGENGGANSSAFVGNNSTSRFDGFGLKATLEAKNADHGAHPGFCGDIKFKIWWIVRSAKKPGWVVQDVTITWDIKDASDKPVSAKSVSLKSPSHYWEAWAWSGGLMTNPPDDNFDWGDEGCTKGTVTWTGKAAFYEDTLLPSSMIPNNPETLANSLPSSTSDPKLTGGTDPVSHELQIKWDCTKCALQRTEIIKQTPK